MDKHIIQPNHTLEIFELFYFTQRFICDNAADLMKCIGKEGKYVTRESYLEWPLFHHFRNTTQFLETYRQIYGSDFITDIERKVENIDLAREESLALAS